MNKILLSLFLAFGFYHGYSQSILMSGIVMSNDDKPIPFAHTYSYKNFGTSCNENGYFMVKLDSSMIHDSVIFSAIGFYEKKLAISTLLSKDTLLIKLKKKEYMLNEVQITSSTETLTLGPGYINDAFEMYFISSVPFQIGILIEVPFQAKLKAAQFYIKKSKYAKTPFRVRVYKYDTITHKPSTELTQNIVLGKLEKRKGWANVNLESENIFVNNESVFVAFETVFMGDDYYHQTKITGEKRDLYGATLTNNVFDKNIVYYKTFLKNYNTNTWDELIFNPNNIDLSFPLIKIEVKK